MEKIIYTTKINTGRQFEFDVMKVFAIFFMVIIHVGDTMAQFDYSVMPSGFYRLFLSFIGGAIGCPMLYVCYGSGNGVYKA